jgi:formylglycine-generating enzyme required for sulfatase activity
MAQVPGGTFAPRGTGNPTLAGQPVKVEPFCLDLTEVTVAAFASCVKTGKCSEPVAHDSDDNQACTWKSAPPLDTHPINCVLFSQAKEYCASLNKRLPTEEEWEWAARGGDKGLTHPWGNEAPTQTRLNACGSECVDDSEAPLFPGTDGHRLTAPVGSYPATAFGLRDIVGNVWEWTAFEVGDATRIARGGAYTATSADTVSASALIRYNPKASRPFIGFRCAK